MHVNFSSACVLNTHQIEKAPLRNDNVEGVH